MMKRLISIFFFCFLSFTGVSAFAAEGKVTVFVSSSCHECAKVKQGFLAGIEKEYRGKFSLEYKDIADIENYKLYLSLAKRSGISSAKTPAIFFAGSFLNGSGEIKEKLPLLLASRAGLAGEWPGVPGNELLEHFRAFTPLVIIGVGAIDGINPCAFTVIVFFISFLSLQGYRKRELLAIGLSFITAVFLTYFLLGLGVFNFFYRLRGFWLVSRMLNYAIGAFSLTLGALALHDLYIYKVTGRSEGMALQLPKTVKRQIHKVIGLQYRQDKSAAGKRQFWGLAFSALLTGFLVSLLEAVCTGQTYLPTITFILKTAPLKLQALGYLVLYNVMFIIPLLVIFMLAMLGATSEDFSAFLKKRMGAVKILMAAVFLGMGIFLLWRA